MKRLLAIAAAALLVSQSVAYHEPPQIRCFEGHCLVPKADFETIVRQAQKVEAYAEMCGWQR